jgi:hypothetical protein
MACSRCHWLVRPCNCANCSGIGLIKCYISCSLESLTSIVATSNHLLFHKVFWCGIMALAVVLGVAV